MGRFAEHAYAMMKTMASPEDIYPSVRKLIRRVMDLVAKGESYVQRIDAAPTHGFDPGMINHVLGDLAEF